MKNPDLENYYLPALRGHESGPVLDFGSGPGRIIDFLFSKGFQDVRGFERNPEWSKELSAAAAKATTFGNNWEAYLGSANARWSGVVLKDVLYYFPDAAALDFLKGLKKSMAPGGVVLVEVFNGAHFTAVYTKNKDRGIQRVFTEHSLRSILEEAGFRVGSVVGMKPEVTGVRSLAFWLGSRIWHFLLRSVFWLERGTDSQNPKILEKKILAVAVHD